MPDVVFKTHLAPEIFTPLPPVSECVTVAVTDPSVVAVVEFKLIFALGAVLSIVDILILVVEVFPALSLTRKRYVPFEDTVYD